MSDVSASSDGAVDRIFKWQTILTGLNKDVALNTTASALEPSMHSRLQPCSALVKLFHCVQHVGLLPGQSHAQANAAASTLPYPEIQTQLWHPSSTEQKHIEHILEQKVCELLVSLPDFMQASIAEKCQIALQFATDKEKLAEHFRDQDEKARCTHRMLSGPNKGKQCEGRNCHAHKKTTGVSKKRKRVPGPRNGFAVDEPVRPLADKDPEPAAAQVVVPVPVVTPAAPVIPDSSVSVPATHKKCLNCGNLFEIASAWNTSSRNCSQKCSANLPRACSVCAAKFQPPPIGKHYTVCCDDCAAKAYEQNPTLCPLFV